MAKYRVKFPTSPKEDIDRSCYVCSGYYVDEKPDSLSISADSLNLETPVGESEQNEEEDILPENEPTEATLNQEQLSDE